MVTASTGIITYGGIASVRGIHIYARAIMIPRIATINTARVLNSDLYSHAVPISKGRVRIGQIAKRWPNQ